MINSLGIANLLVQFSPQNWAAVVGRFVMLVVWKTTSQPEGGTVGWEAGWEAAACPGRLLTEAP